MAISTTIRIHIGGELLTRFSKLVLHQKAHTHHTFSILQPLPKEYVNQIDFSNEIASEVTIFNLSSIINIKLIDCFSVYPL